MMQVKNEKGEVIGYAFNVEPTWREVWQAYLAERSKPKGVERK